MQLTTLPCADCGADLAAIGETYALHAALAERLGPARDSLCVGCAETRLGRRLQAADFAPALINRLLVEQKSPRLRERLGLTERLDKASATLRCVVYVRVSSEEQLDGHSPEAQRDLCLAYAQARGWQVVKVFLEDRSAKSAERRPEFQAAVGYIRQGQADVFLTQKIDRFARNVVDGITYLDEFAKHGALYCSASEPVDFTTPLGRVMFTQFMQFAEYFLVNLSAETRKGKRKRAEKGLWNGDLPFGYRSVDDGRRAELDPAAAEGVRLAWREYQTGLYSDLEIARLLNDNGYRTSGKRGPQPFSKDTVRSMLSNPFYAGVVAYKGQLYPGQHPALISLAAYDACQAVRRRKRQEPRTAARGRRVYPLARLLYCAHCGRPLRAEHAARHRYYRDPAYQYGENCPGGGRVRADQVERELANCLGDLPATWQTTALERLAQTSNAAEIERRRGQVRARINRLRDQYIDGLLGEQDYHARLAEARSELDGLKPVERPDLEHAARLLADFPALWAVATDQEKHKLARAMFERVYVRGGRVVGIQPRPEFYPLMLSGWKRTRRDSVRLPTTTLTLPALIPPGQTTAPTLAALAG